MEEVNAEEDRAVKDVWVMVKLIFIRTMDGLRACCVCCIYKHAVGTRARALLTCGRVGLSKHSCLRFIFFFFKGVGTGLEKNTSEIRNQHKLSIRSWALATCHLPGLFARKKKEAGGLWWFWGTTYE